MEPVKTAGCLEQCLVTQPLLLLQLRRSTLLTGLPFHLQGPQPVIEEMAQLLEYNHSRL